MPSYMGNLAAVGAPRPTWQELSPALMTHSTVYVDSEVSANSESGDVVLSGAQVYAEIGDVINGSKSALKQRRTIFKSLGNSTPTLLSSVHCLKMTQSILIQGSLLRTPSRPAWSSTPTAAPSESPSPPPSLPEMNKSNV